MPNQKKQNKRTKLKTNIKTRGWYTLIAAAIILLASTLPIFSSIHIQLAVQIVGYITIAVAIAIELSDVVKNKSARLQIDLFMTSFAVVLVFMAGYFVLSERGNAETSEIRSTVQQYVPGIRDSLPKNSVETGGTLSDVWLSKTENYVFVEYITNKSLPESVDATDGSLKQHVVDIVCSDNKYTSVLEKGYGFTFLYTSTVNGKTYQVNVTSSDC